MIDISDARLDALPVPDTRRFGFVVSDFKVQLRGICKECREQEDKKMKRTLFGLLVAAGLAATAVLAADATPAKPPLGLPPVPIPADNLQTPEKVALGDKLFDDKRFSSTGQVACNTCHESEEGLHRQPPADVGGHREGRQEADRHAQRAHRRERRLLRHDVLGRPLLEPRGPVAAPLRQPVEMGLKDHQPILKIVRTDPAYVKAFEQVFGKKGAQVTMKEVQQAIAAFERTKVSGDSPFDRYFYGGESGALTDAQKRGFDLYVNKGRCVSCHGSSRPQALFTDNRFHNIGVGHQRHPEGRARAGRGVPPGEGDARRGRREGPRRQADLGARALRRHPRLRGAGRLQDPDAAQRGRHLRPTCTTAA